MNSGVFRKRRPAAKQGFTLLEVAIATLILGIGILAFMGLQIRAIRSNAFSNAMTVASSIAQNQIETVRAMAWGEIDDGTTTETVADTDPRTGSMRVVFTSQRSIETDTTGRMKEVSVTVSWNQNGHSHQIAVNTKVAKRE